MSDDIPAPAAYRALGQRVTQLKRERDEARALLLEGMKAWSFNDDQRHTHTWHDWADWAAKVKRFDAALSRPSPAPRGADTEETR